jgi:hypothetical protein
MTWKGLPPWLLADAGLTNENGLTYVPYFTPGGELQNRRVVAGNGDRWWETAGRDLIPFGLEQLVPPYTAERPLFLCEGESDALALRAVADRAFDVLGLPGASSWRPEWRSYMEPWAVIYACGDGDDAGRRMNTRVKHAIPWSRPVWLPDGEDLRSLIQAGGLETLEPYVAEADWYARASAALKLARNVDEVDALMRGEDVDVGWEPDLAA